MNPKFNRLFHYFMTVLVFINQVVVVNPSSAFAVSELQFQQERATTISSEAYQAVVREEAPPPIPLQALGQLSQSHTLSPVDEEQEEETADVQPEKISNKNSNPISDPATLNRESFDYNRPLLNQASEDGLPVAFITDDLDAETLKSLVNENLSEVLFLAFRSEDQVKYLVYSSGDEDDVRVNPFIHDLILSLQSQGSVLVAHTHVDSASHGPSAFDQAYAEQTEAVLTADGAYLYGLDKAAPEHRDYDALMEWFQSLQNPLDEKRVIDAVGQLIAEVDMLREELQGNPELGSQVLAPFRKSSVTTDERITIPSAYVSTTVIPANTADKIDADIAYEDEFDVSILSTARLRVSYSELDFDGESAGVTIHNADDSVMDLSALPELIFKLSSSEAASDIKVEIVQSGTALTDVFNIAGVGITEQTYQLDLTQLSFNPGTIQSIRFSRDSTMSPGGRGYFDVVLPSQSGYGIDSSLADSSKAEGDITQLPLGSTQGSIADTASGAVSVLSDQSAAGATVNYSGLNAADGAAGVTWDYTAEGKDFSKRKTIVLALEGTAAGARFEIEDTVGRRAAIDLTGISGDDFNYYTIDLNDPAIASLGVNLSKIRRVNVVTDQTLAGNAIGTLRVKLAVIAPDAPLTGTTKTVTQLQTGKYEIKVYTIDPTRTDFHGKLLSHTIQQNKGGSNYEITTFEVLSDGTDTGKWLTVWQQKLLATKTYEIKTYAIEGDEAGSQTKGSLLHWFIQAGQSDGSTVITELDPDSTLQQIVEQKALSATKLEIWTDSADFSDAAIQLGTGSAAGSSVTGSDNKLTATLTYAGLDSGDASVFASAAWVYSATTWPTGVNLTDMTLNFSLKGTAAAAFLVLEDSTGQKKQVPLSAISASSFTPFSISTNDAAITGAVDITKIKKISFLVDGPDAGNVGGTLNIKLDELPYKNTDGIKGALQSHVIQEYLGDGTFRITTYKVIGGASLDEVTSIVDQNEIAENTFDIKTYDPVVVPSVVLDSQDFEGVFPPEGFATSGDVLWNQDAETFHEGAAAAAAGDITDSQRSVLTQTYEASADGTLSFFWKVSSEENFDYLYFCVDQETCTKGTSLSSISGEQDWDQYSTALSAGSHTLTWVYEKDNLASSGSDLGWVDDIQFATNQTINPVLKTHIIQEVLTSETSRITTFNVIDGVSTEDVISIVQQRNVAADTYEVTTYAVNPDGTPGALQSDIIQRDFGGNTFRTLTYKVQDDDFTDEVVSIVEQSELATDIFEIKTYQDVVTPGTVQQSEGFEADADGYSTSGDVGFFLDGSVVHEGASSAASGDINDLQRSVLGTTINAAEAGVVSFFWKVSSEENFDFFYFCIDQDQDACTLETSTTGISGETDWAEYTANLAAGSHTLTWVYEKDDSESAGDDMGWLDDVQFATNQTITTVLQSDIIQQDLGSGNYRISTIEVIDGEATDVVSSVVEWTQLTPTTFDIKSYQDQIEPGVVLQTENFEGDFPPAGYTTSGVVSWLQNVSVVHDGIASAQSGDINDSEQSILTTTYNAPEAGVFSFYWKVSSEENFDYLYFCVDQGTCTRANAVSAISGEVDWAQISANLTAGSHTLTWIYEKDSSDSLGSDTSWIDGAAFTSNQVVTPILQTHVVQENLEGGNYRVTTYKVEDGVALEEVLSTADQADPVVEIKNTEIYQVASDPIGIRAAGEIDPVQPFSIVTQAGATNTPNAGDRFDPDDGNLIVETPDEVSPNTDDDLSDDNFLGRDVANNNGSSGSTGASGFFSNREKNSGESYDFKSPSIATSEWSSLSSSGGGKGKSGTSSEKEGQGGSSETPFNIKGLIGSHSGDSDQDRETQIESTGDPVSDSMLFFQMTPLERMELENSSSKFFESLEYLQFKAAQERKAAQNEEKGEPNSKKDKNDKAAEANLFKRFLSKMFGRKSRSSRERNLRWLQGQRGTNQAPDPHKTMLYQG